MEEGFIRGDSMERKASKTEEALEIKALRRIISAYLNYSAAAEEDVKRWERSYARLQSTHKALVAHLPKKYQQLRRCIAANSFFILNMLQAFEPPFDMSQDCGSCEHEDIERHFDNVDNPPKIQAEVPKPHQMKDAVNANAKGMHSEPAGESLESKDQDSSAAEALGDTFATDDMLNNRVQNLSSGRSTSDEVKASVDAVLDERNLCPGQSTSASDHTTPLACNNGRPSADLGSDRIKSRSDSAVNQMPMAIVQDNALDTIHDPVVHGCLVSCGCSKSTPNACESRTIEAFDQSGCCSLPAANGEANCPAIDWRDPAFQLHVPPADVEKVRCIIRNIVRDWAPEGAIEREQCYKPILEELHWHFPNRSKDRPPSCLVPGAGLARLALEISRLGFISQGNEFSYYMMMCSSFILNHTRAPMEWVIYPWIHSNCNSLSDEDQFRPVYFPDLHPGSAGITEGFSMCAGDFVEVYNDLSQSGTWDAVVTCFFIDTAHNVVEYMEIISKVLKHGGVWINLGPLLYHFADTYASEDEMSIELSLEDVKRIAFHYGFELERERTIETTYTANPRSMMQKFIVQLWIYSRNQMQKLL